MREGASLTSWDGCEDIRYREAPSLQERLEDAVPVAMFKGEVATWARRIGVEPREIHIRPMKRKWASCSTRGRLTFDPELLQQPGDFRAEVIAHELLHLKVPSHGKVFKQLLRAYLAELTRSQEAGG